MIVTDECDAIEIQVTCQRSGRDWIGSKIAMYGDTPGAMRALVDVLLGRERAPGRLPVPVDDVARTGC